MRILLVEDDPAAARTIRDNLAKAGRVATELRWVRSLDEALLALERDADVILLDLGLSDSDGLTTLHAVRRATRDTAVVLLTDVDDEEVALRSLRHGADDYLVKARADPEALARAIRYAVCRRRAAVEERTLLEDLQRVGATLTSELSGDDVVEKVLREAVARTHASAGGVLLGDDENGGRMLVTCGLPRDALERVIDETPLLRAALEQSVFVRIADLYVERSEAAELPPVRSLLATPIHGRGGQRGMLLLVEENPGALDDTDERIAAGIASWAAVALENARLFQEREQAVHAREELLAVVSHDLRNPLNVMAQAAALMTMSDTVSERERCEEHIKRAISRMNRLIGDLLDDAAIEKGALTLRRLPLDPGELVREACASAAAAIGDRHRIVPVVEDKLPRIDADGDRVLQVLGNLVGNAAKLTPAGGEITVVVERAWSTVRFSVVDDGPGVPEEEVPRLFQRFYKGVGASRDGAGLGLAIARGIVEAHGGSMWLDGSSGAQGATFSFTLPAATSVETSRPTAVAASAQNERYGS